MESIKLPTLARASAVRTWHRRIAWLALIAVLTFAVTGLLHPVMSRFQPQPALRSLPLEPALAADFSAPAGVLAAAGITSVRSLRVARVGGQWYLRAQLPEGLVQYLAVDGRSVDIERQHAEHLARQYTGLMAAPVNSLRLLTEFENDYPYVSRFLPVWRVEFATDDARVAYVSTENDRLTGLSNTYKATFQTVFRALHTWAWLPSPLRSLWVYLLLTALLATTLIGIILFARSTGPRQRGLRWMHRYAGMGLALAALAWASSGALQFWGAAERENPVLPSKPERISAATLRAVITPPAGQVIEQARLVTVAGQPHWRWPLLPAVPTTGQGRASPEHEHHHAEPSRSNIQALALYVRADTGAASPEAEIQHIRELRSFLGLDMADAQGQVLHAFTPEYGFINKRLPVIRLSANDGSAKVWFLDPADQMLVAVASPTDGIKGFIFANAHKWEFLTRVMGKDGRDLVAAIGALGLVLLGIVGLILQIRKRAR